MKKKMLILGGYEGDYPRNKILIDSLKEVFDVCEINVGVWGRKRYFDLFIKALKHKREEDFVFLMYPAYQTSFFVFFIKPFLKGKIILDAYVSTYDTLVSDRSIYKKNSLKAFILYFFDFFSFRVAHIIAFNTNEDKKYFTKKFKINKKKKSFILPVFIDTEYFKKIEPAKNEEIFPKDKFNVCFYGTYIPLHGIEYIIKTADILKNKNIKFIIIGTGQTKDEIMELYNKLGLENILFIDSFLPYQEVISLVKASDLCLGIFSDVHKAKRVIANKVVEMGACTKPLITIKNKEMELYFEDKKDLLYCKSANAEDLAEKIMYAKENREEMKKQAFNFNKKVKKYFDKEVLVKMLKRF